MTKLRLDVLLTQKGLVESRARAQALIMAGKVQVNGQPVIKAGTQVDETVELKLARELPFVSRGGQKLAAGLDAFALNPTNLVCADVGASTGGFTDVLLQRGAARVYAIDVGYGQLAWKLRQDPRVTVMERTNARYLETLPEPVHLVTIDASFISLQKLLPTVIQWFAGEGRLVTLVKPQFEAGKNQVGKGGVVRDKAIHRQVLTSTINYARTLNLTLLGGIISPITGPAGNHEFLLYFGRQVSIPPVDDTAVLEKCLDQSAG